ncbi:DNA replication complex GINS protein SLD5 C-terminal domain-containing protein [Caenorhabditis elegans]|nr:DNA replication complex GINS protein SLD5 C-terminal domain-containing protein [Caenorhabditis elegans]CBW44394.1 DNA replication complex GINS protein SLD5 C-terminal domain-containing protein [Caenorhabditis elegans]|eukprot:NP_001256904.1 DNA replication complex GINS protein SLD5 [Caenorhabditis elegans]
MKFAEEYALAESNLFQKTVLEFMPAALKKMPVPRGDHDDVMVYAKVTSDDVGNVAIPDWQDLNGEVILEMEPESCHLIPFESVHQLVEDGNIQLM